MSKNDESQEATLLWDEYKYRHEHCWTTIFRLTSAAVLLGVVPYVAPPDMNFPCWLLAPPILAVSLIVVAMFRMHSELELLRQIRNRHRKRQVELYNFVFPGQKRRGTFDQHVWSYLGFLLLLAVANVAVSAWHLAKLIAVASLPIEL